MKWRGLDRITEGAVGLFVSVGNAHEGSRVAGQGLYLESIELIRVLKGEGLTWVLYV